MAKGAFDVIEEELKAKLEAQQAVISNGSAKDYAQYREHCGVIKGLQFAMYEIRKMRDRMESENE